MLSRDTVFMFADMSWYACHFMGVRGRFPNGRQHFFNVGKHLLDVSRYLSGVGGYLCEVRRHFLVFADMSGCPWTFHGFHGPFHDIHGLFFSLMSEHIFQLSGDISPLR